MLQSIWTWTNYLADCDYKIQNKTILCIEDSILVALVVIFGNYSIQVPVFIPLTCHAFMYFGL